MEFKPILEIFEGWATIQCIVANGRTIRTTSEHPFYVYGKGWVPCHSVQRGDRLRSHNGRTVVVEDVYSNGVQEKVYDFRVEEHHTYFVGCAEWGLSVWAHNEYAQAEQLGLLQKRLKQLGYDDASITAIMDAIRNGEAVAIIGENMKRVRALESMVNGAGGTAVTWNPRNQQSPSLEANRSWLRYWAQQNGAPAIDIGPQPTYREMPSDFYAMENRSIRWWGIPTPFGTGGPL